jgi:hypothetical protein
MAKAENKKIHSSDFVVRLVGSGIKPWHVPMRSLARLMDAIQRLVAQDEEEDVDSSEDEAEVQDDQIVSLGSNVLKLVGIRATSAGYAISTPFRESALSVLATTGNAIENPTESEWTGPTISSLKDVSEIAKALRVKVEIRESGSKRRLGDVIARITPETYDQVSKSAFVHGDTSLFGRVVRIGGAEEARCALRIPDQSKLVYCGVASDELARKLSNHLYDDVTVHGEATWLRATWRICRFDINSFDPPKTGTFQAALDDIWRAGGKAWDKVKDPDKFISEMRG